MVETVTEWCPECDSESELKKEFVPQLCNVCNSKILPCAQCEKQNCANCPFD